MAGWITCVNNAGLLVENSARRMTEPEWDDSIAIDAVKRTLQIDVSAAELRRRRAKWKAPKPYATNVHRKVRTDGLQRIAGRGDGLTMQTGSQWSRDAEAVANRVVVRLSAAVTVRRLWTGAEAINVKLMT